MQNNQEAKEKERKQAANKANKLEAKCKEIEGKLEAELKAKDHRIAALEAKCKEMEGKLEAELKAKECAHGESGEGVNNHSLGGKYLLTCELVLICVGA
jgi:predicted  nucleic acid-binding Zn-ribbon protein